MKFLRFLMGYIKGLYSSLGVGTLSPVSPSPYQGEGEVIERGASPLLHTRLLKRASQADIEVGELKRGFASLT